MTENVKKLIEKFGGEEYICDVYYSLFLGGGVEVGQELSDDEDNFSVNIISVKETVENVNIESQYAEQVTRIVFSHSDFPNVLFMVENMYESWGGGHTKIHEVIPETVQVTNYKVVK